MAYLFVLFALWMANLMDLALTLSWTGSVGWTAEGNLIMRHIALVGGSLGFVLYKMLLMSLVCLVLWWLYLRVEDLRHHARRRFARLQARAMHHTVIGLTAMLAGFYGWVIVNNLTVMGYV